MIGARKVIVLLMLGGAGSRLWPASHDDRPKQFLKLFGDRSLFQRTLARLDGLPVDGVVITTHVTLERLVDDDLADLGARAELIVLEPVRRDSGPAPAAGVAAIRARHGEQAIIIALPADHLIHDASGFARSVHAAITLAADDRLVTFGIQPTFPSTQYGYIQRGTPLAPDHGAFRVAKFHEKPTLAVAERYLHDGGYVWNSGMFVFAAHGFSTEAARHMPDVWNAAETAVAKGRQTGDRLLLDETTFGAARKTSIDYALFEKSTKVAVITAGFDWSDIGNWASVQDAIDADPQGNALIGAVVAEDVHRSLVYADGVPVVVVGVENLTVVASERGTFIAPRDRAADIKALVERLARKPV